jgi:tRNA 2-thiouridine synthesizing protein A
MEEVDVTGEVCPRPALVVRRCLAAMDPGDELLVRGDYPPAERNLRRTCYKHGFAVADGPNHDQDGAFELVIRVTEDAALQDA